MHLKDAASTILYFSEFISPLLIFMYVVVRFYILPSCEEKLRNYFCVSHFWELGVVPSNYLDKLTLRNIWTSVQLEMRTIAL
mmetsp:Transcript_13859/g.19234  ORF Transcript_13859/g.19234 Transcript_13859/m.19234 type:complete len:82 (+) Transcript_13859:95-340(+)